MTVQAAVAVYKKELIAKYEANTSDLAFATTKEMMANGLTVTWDVAGSDGGEVVTRGQNGDIPYGGPSNTQITATLVEYHAAHSITGFDVFASQGNQVDNLRNASLAKIRRHQTDVILAELANATQDFGSGSTLDTATILGAQAILGDNDVPTEEQDNMFCVISTRARAYLMQNTEYASGDYVDVKPFTGPVRKMWRWAGINFIVTSRVSGSGTSAELCYMFHRAAIGYAVNMGEEKVFAGFNEEQGRSWSRAEIYDAAKILQNTGIIKISHDGSAIAAT